MTTKLNVTVVSFVYSIHTRLAILKIKYDTTLYASQFQVLFRPVFPLFKTHKLRRTNVYLANYIRL